jgi:hypothetical protein
MVRGDDLKSCLNIFALGYKSTRCSLRSSESAAGDHPVTEVWALLPRRCSAFSATAVNRPVGRIAPASTVSFRYTPVTRRGCMARNAVPTLSIAAISTRRVPKAVIGIAPVPSENAARRGPGRAGIRTVVQNETARLCHQTPGQDKSLV